MKEFLSQQNIPFNEIDLAQQPDKEDEMKQEVGSRIVPGIIIRKKRLLGLSSKKHVFIGFEPNEQEIKSLL
ncbi:glutaredoxin family protein [Bacillus marinisedimentorum]|uniref:glutaredoxin family protein n=1 Tax=Bacillus marinisedimentorum TaxID=1821260 RepID=UPI001471E34D|nr:glutaredoxin family protein [Bacillus marinisedimentorum]